MENSQEQINALVERFGLSETVKQEIVKISTITKDKEIGLYEKYLDEFTDKNGLLEKCNPDAIFNWFANNIWRK